MMAGHVTHRDRARYVTAPDGTTCVHPYEPTEPTGYVAWYEWAPKYGKTHKQKPCQKCGILLWVRHPDADTTPDGVL